MNKLIAYIASAVILIQNSYLFLYSGKEGFGLYSLFFFLPVVIALVTLWSAYAYCNRRGFKHSSRAFVAISLLIIGVSEFLLPASPIKTTYLLHVQQGAISKTLASDISDEPFLSKHSNPIGIRIKYTVQFPRSGIYGADSVFWAKGEKSTGPYWSKFEGINYESIEPEPAAVRNKPGARYFNAGVAYRVSLARTPNFIRVDQATKNACVAVAVGESIVAETEEHIKESAPKQYEGFIGVNGDNFSFGFARNAIIAQFLTKNSYSLRTFYDSALREGGHCGEQ